MHERGCPTFSDADLRKFSDFIATLPKPQPAGRWWRWLRHGSAGRGSGAAESCGSVKPGFLPAAIMSAPRHQRADYAEDARE